MSVITNDFPKEKLKLLFYEASHIIVLQPPELELAILTDNFAAGLRKALILKKDTVCPKMILFSAFTEVFRYDESYDEVHSYADYAQYVKEELNKKHNVLVVDLTNDPQQKSLFEFDRMQKWPVKQRPFYSYLAFAWHNLPQGKGKENTIASRYLLLIEEIIGRSLFIKPRFPKIGLPIESESKYQKICQRFELLPKQLLQVGFLVGQNDPETFPLDLLVMVAELLHQKKRHVEFNFIEVLELDKGNKKEVLNTLFQKYHRFSFFRTLKWHYIPLTLSEAVVFFQRQRLVVGSILSYIHLAGALGVKTVSIRGPRSRHFISNYRWDEAIYPELSVCPYLVKSDTFHGKGYVAPCYNKKKCLQEDPCFSRVKVEKIVEKCLQII